MSDGLSFRIGGDLGDACMSLALLHAIPGKHVLRCVDRVPVSPFLPRVPLIKPLFECQPYVESMECSEKECDVDLTGFRRWHSSTTILYDAQAAEYNFQTGENLVITGEPWMTVEPDKSFVGKVIIARSERYNNSRFPWSRVVEHYGSRLVFVGLPKEHALFCASFGKVPHMAVKDFLELARAMAGCSLVIANQSSPQAVAMAVGSPIIQETCDWQPDVVIPRSNVQYVCDGGATLPDVAGSGELVIPSVPDIPPNFNTSMVPPDFWQFKGLPPSTHFALQATLVKQMENCSQREAEDLLLRANAKRVPSFFNHTGTGNDPMDLFRQAMANAFHGDRSAHRSY